jgi:hypothetical protein
VVATAPAIPGVQSAQDLGNGVGPFTVKAGLGMIFTIRAK